MGRVCSIPCRASCFALVYLEETVEFNRFFQIDRLNSTESSKYVDCPPNRHDGICLCFFRHPSSMPYTAEAKAPPPFIINFGDVSLTPEPLLAVLGTASCLNNCPKPTVYCGGRGGAFASIGYTYSLVYLDKPIFMK